MTQRRTLASPSYGGTNVMPDIRRRPRRHIGIDRALMRQRLAAFWLEHCSQRGLFKSIESLACAYATHASSHAVSAWLASNRSP